MTDLSVTLRMAAGLIALVALSLGGNAQAGDGRTQINQVRATAGSVTASDTAGFPVTLDVEGSYVLTSNLTVATSSIDAIQITANNVTLDLNGFRIQGPGSCTGNGSTLSCSGAGSSNGIDAGFSVHNARVRNGLIRGFGSAGLQISGDGAVIEDVTVDQNGLQGIKVDSGAVIRGCMAVRNWSTGIEVGSGARISDSTTMRNRRDGLGIQGSGVILRTTNWGNGDDGILVAEGVVGDSVALANEGSGIEAFRDSLLRNNTAYNNGVYGALMSGGGIAFDHNVFDSNTSANMSGSGTNLNANVCGGNTTCP